MLRELQAQPSVQSGFLGYSIFGLGVVIQYWRSFDHLEACARIPERAHFPAWRKFNRLMKDARTDLGIWQETYLVRAAAHVAVSRTTAKGQKL